MKLPPIRVLSAKCQACIWVAYGKGVRLRAHRHARKTGHVVKATVRVR